MHLYFAGAEVSSHLAVLRSCGVERVAVNINNLARTNADLSTWASQQRLDGLEWALYTDGHHSAPDPFLEVVQGAVVQPEILTGPVDWYESTWLANTDLLYLPTWDAADPTVLRDYTQNYDGVTLPDSVVDNPVAVRQARAAINRLGQLAALTGRSKGIERFDTLVSSAWWAVQKYGETQVWAGNRLVRLNSADKIAKRQKYADAIHELGVDVDKVLMDDPVESVRLAVLSWLALEAHLARGNTLTTTPVVANGAIPVVANPGSSPAGVANGGTSPRHVVLPVIGTSVLGTTHTDDDGNEYDDRVPTVTSSSISLRQCNSCSLAMACPMHTQNASCSYEIPVQIASKPQLVAVLRAVTEIQTQRVLMGRFGEEVNGEMDTQVGKEMDRLFGMVEKWREIEDTRDTVKLSLEAKGHADAGLGVISRLFGRQAGANAVLLEEPIDPDEIIHEVMDES